MKTWKTKNGYTIMRLLTGRCNVFTVQQGGRFILIDTGGHRIGRLLIKRIDALVAAGNSFSALVMTHSHFDHAGNAAAIAERYHVPVYVMTSELEFLAGGSNPPILGVMGLTRLINKLPQEHTARWFRYTPVMGALALDVMDGGVDNEMEGVRILPTPGHTPGSVSIIVDDEIAIVGDTMHGVFPGNAYPPFASDEKALLESWGRLLKTGCMWFLPAHGGERNNRFIANQYARLHTNE